MNARHDSLADRPIASVMRPAEPSGGKQTPEIVRRETAGALAYHAVWLVVSLAVIISAWLLDVRGERRIVVRGLGLAVPGTCSFKTFTGIDCPGCGLTRCFVSLARGRWRRAWHFNPAGIYFFALLAFQIPYRAVQCWRAWRGKSTRLPAWVPITVLGTLAGALLIQWLVRLAMGQITIG